MLEYTAPPAGVWFHIGCLVVVVVVAVKVFGDGHVSSLLRALHDAYAAAGGWKHRK